MTLIDLLSSYCPLRLPDNIQVTGLSLDSRHIQPGDLFVALTGTQKDGRQFIIDAIAKGACTILSEGTEITVEHYHSVPMISLPALRTKLGYIAAQFYGYPAKHMRMLGVTGTSGKTSCTQFIGAILQHLNQACGIIGTLGNGLYGQITAGNLTTPDAITLQKTLRDFVHQGAAITAMEVSSHSLDQHRVNGFEFDVGIFTNLTRDHLDYHVTMEAYGAAKKRLFDQSRYAVINADDVFGQELLRAFQHRPHVLAYSTNAQQHAAVYATNVHLTAAGIQATVVTPWGTAELHSSLVGQFNLSNLLAVITALGLLDIPLTAIVQGIRQLQPVSGRMQSIGGMHNQPLVIIDYAHKPDALQKVLEALRQQCSGKLYCVFGCGGDRDRGKRPLMAKIAEQYADQVIVTDDNPRHEDPTQIVADILRGFAAPAKVIVQHDRSQAIRHVIQCAAAGDCVLIAGKGAETYQQIGEQKLPFSDLEKVNDALKENNNNASLA